MAAPTPSTLDANQCIQGSFDEANGALRIEGILPQGAVEVAIDASSDNIAIKDPTSGYTLKVNADGSINADVVIVPATPGIPVSVYNEISGVAMGSTQLVTTYTVPAGNPLALTRVDVSGDSIATFVVEFNSAVNAKRRLYYTEFNTVFEYSNSQDGFNLPAGTVIDVYVTNNSVQGAGAFNATIMGVKS